MQNFFILLESDAHSNRDMQDQKQATSNIDAKKWSRDIN